MIAQERGTAWACYRGYWQACEGGRPSKRHARLTHPTGRVASGTFVHPSESEAGDSQECFNLPSLAGSGGRCVSDLEGHWQCLTQFDALPYSNIRAHGVVEATGVEWLMSNDSLTSRGLQPQDQFYSISALFDESDVRLTWLAVPASADEGVWVGTNGHGLLHLLSSPQQVTRYTTADGLPDGEIRDIQTCGINCVWVATPLGIGRWDGSQWVTYTTHQGLPSNDVRGISFDSLYRRDTASVWAATAAGPALFVKQANRWQAAPGWPSGIEVTGIMEKWVSTRGQGLLQFIAAPAARGRTESFTTDDGLPDNRITALAATARGVLVGTPRGAVEWNGVTWIPVMDAPVNDASSEMIGTERGLWVWNGGDWEHITGERVTHVTEDGWYTTDGQVCQWTSGGPHCLLTDGGKLLAGAQSVYATPGGETVAVVSSDGELWEYDARACDGGCLVIRGYRSLDICDRIIPPRINDLIAYEGEFWIATDEGMYSSWAGGGDRGLAGGWPVAVRAVSLEGRIVWLATDQGAYYTDPGSRPYGWSYVPDLPDRDLSVILPLPDGSAWIGTMSAGLIHFEPAKE